MANEPLRVQDRRPPDPEACGIMVYVDNVTKTYAKADAATDEMELIRLWSAVYVDATEILPFAERRHDDRCPWERVRQGLYFARDRAAEFLRARGCPLDVDDLD